MKRLLVLFAAAMLLGTPAMAANSTIMYKGPQGQGSAQGSMEKVINQTTVKDSQMINNGMDNRMSVGTIDNKGKMKEVINQTDVKNTQMINNGTGNEMRVGTITNQ